MFFETQNSTYELDADNHRVRRLVGKNHPTYRQGSDGQWQEYLHISAIEIGSSVIISWEIQELPNDCRITKVATTITSTVVAISSSTQ